MTRDQSEAARDSFGCFGLALAASREKRIRARDIRPRPDNSQELRWWLEGEVENRNLEMISQQTEGEGRQG